MARENARKGSPSRQMVGEAKKALRDAANAVILHLGFDPGLERFGNNMSSLLFALSCGACRPDDQCIPKLCPARQPRPG